MKSNKETSEIRRFLLNQLSKLYDAEQRATKMLPRMSAKVTFPELRKTFDFHLAETFAHIVKLEMAFTLLDTSPIRAKSSANIVAIKEAEEIIEHAEKNLISDKKMIVAARKIEHFKIVGYSSLISLASQTEEDHLSYIFNEVLDEERKLDLKFSNFLKTN